MLNYLIELNAEKTRPVRQLTTNKIARCIKGLERSRFGLCSNQNQFVLASQNVLPINLELKPISTLLKKAFAKQKQRFDVQIYVVSKVVKLQRQSNVFILFFWWQLQKTFILYYV